MDSSAVSSYLLFPPSDPRHPHPGMGHRSTRPPPPHLIHGSHDDGRERVQPGAVGGGTGRGHVSMSPWQPLPHSEPVLTSASIPTLHQTQSSEYTPIFLWLIAETMVTYGNLWHLWHYVSTHTSAPPLLLYVCGVKDEWLCVPVWYNSVHRPALS